MDTTTLKNGTIKTYYTAAETAKLVRRDLKAAYPGQKFSVRSQTYAGGASIDIKYTDGPTVTDVTAIIIKYKGASFDGMIDLETSIDSTDDNGNLCHYGSKYIGVERKESPETLARCVAQWNAENADKVELITGKYSTYVQPVASLDFYTRQHVEREFHNTMYHTTF